MTLRENLLKLASGEWKKYLIKRLGHKNRILLDYCGPNIAKEMHLSHMRTTILGESLKRLLLYCGYNVKGDIHYGDIGPQMGGLFFGLKENFESLEKGVAHLEQHPEKIFEIQKDVALRAKEDRVLKKIIHEESLHLQYLEGEYSRCRNKIVSISLEHTQSLLDLLNVRFKSFRGESSYISILPDVIAYFKKQKLIELKEGAVFVQEDKKGSYPVFLRGQDGFISYSSIDMAAIYDRVFNQKMDEIIYVIDDRQHRHWNQIFSAWERVNLGKKLVTRLHNRVLDESGHPYKLDPYFGPTFSSHLKAVSEICEAYVRHFFNTPTNPIVKQQLKNLFINCFIKLLDFSQDPEEEYRLNLKDPKVYYNHFCTQAVIQYVRVKQFFKGLTPSNDLEVLEIESELFQRISETLIVYPEVIQRSANILDLSPLCQHLEKLVMFWTSLKNLQDVGLESLHILRLSLDQAEDIFNIFAVFPKDTSFITEVTLK